jgi:predicted Zn-dependent protease
MGRFPSSKPLGNWIRISAGRTRRWRTFTRSKLDLAELELRKELEVDPYSHPAACKLGAVLTQTERADQAIALLGGPARSNPPVFCLRFEPGKALLREGSAGKAVEHLEAAASIDPANPSAHFLLGQAYAKLGQRDKSQAAFDCVRFVCGFALTRTRAGDDC